MNCKEEQKLSWQEIERKKERHRQSSYSFRLYIATYCQVRDKHKIVLRRTHCVHDFIFVVQREHFIQ